MQTTLNAAERILLVNALIDAESALFMQRTKLAPDDRLGTTLVVRESNLHNLRKKLTNARAVMVQE